MNPLLNTYQLTKLVLCLFSFALLSACGGSSGSPEEEPDVAWFLGSEFSNNYALALINAQVLYNDSRSSGGQGVTVAVIDSGIDLNHSEFSGRIDRSNSRDFETVFGDDDGDGNSPDDQQGHGTFVSGILAAGFDGDESGNGIQGVAFNSTILALDVMNGDTGPTPNYLDADIIAALDHIVRLKNNGRNIQVVNMSFGGGTSNASLNAAMKRVTDLGIAIVISAGNSGPVGIESPAQQAGGAEYNGLVVAAAATGSRSAGGPFDRINPATGLPFIADYSNLCNPRDRRYCLAAPGTDIRTTRIGGGYTFVDGTSFSAPIVAGAIALLVEAGGITAAQAVQILLETAYDPDGDTNLNNNPSGFSVTNNTYGNGFLNITRALSPLGTVSTSTGSGMQPITNANLTPSAAFGDAFSDAQAFHNAVMYDSYDRPFIIDVAHFVDLTDSAANIASFTNLTNSTRTEFFEDEKFTITAMYQTEDGDALSSGGTEISLSSSYQLDPDTRAIFSTGGFTGAKATFSFTERATNSFHITDSTAAPFGYMTNGGQQIALQRKYGDWAIEYGFTSASQDFGNVSNIHLKGQRAFESGFNLGWKADVILEDQSFLGTSSEGALNSGYSAGTFAATLGVGYAQGPLELFAQFTQSWTKVESDRLGLLGDFSSIQSQAAILGMSVDNIGKYNDRFTLSYSEPLRVKKGSSEFLGELTADYENQFGRNVSLVPSGKQRNLEISFRRTVTEQTQWGIGLAYILDPNHAAQAENELVLGFRMLHRF